MNKTVISYFCLRAIVNAVIASVTGVAAMMGATPEPAIDRP